MSAFEIIKAQIRASVPFARHAGVELIHLSDGKGEAQLNHTENTINHIGSQHAGALFTLGETASGAAMAGALAPVLSSVRAVASDAQIKFDRIAKGTIFASARASTSGPQLLAEIEATGRVSFEVDVSFTDSIGQRVASMHVGWNVNKLNRA